MVYISIYLKIKTILNEKNRKRKKNRGPRILLLFNKKKKKWREGHAKNTWFQNSYISYLNEVHLLMHYAIIEVHLIMRWNYIIIGQRCTFFVFFSYFYIINGCEFLHLVKFLEIVF